MTTPKTITFADLGLRPELLKALDELGYEEPTPVQAAALPALLEGRDVLGQAATGTGKTAAFALPILQKFKVGQVKPFETNALVIVPTRELAMQVAEAVHTYGRSMGVTVLPIYGGQDIGTQLRRLRKGVDVVVATPGRALDHLRRRTLKLDNVQIVVLDEADEMLDLGFAEDLDVILGGVPKEAQRALFSATLPPRIAAIAESHLKKPVRVRIEATERAKGSLPKIQQVAYVVPDNHKTVALGRILDVASPERALIFCRTRVEVERLTENLAGHGYDVSALHGGMTQDQRDRVLKRFKGHETDLLVATDVAARGLHVDKLSHVINYDMPTNGESYVHRIGRTGRAGEQGHAISLVTPREHRFLRQLERLTGQPIEVAQLPTVVDLRARKLEMTRATVEESIKGEGLDVYRSLLERLLAQNELMDVAAAALKSLHEALNPDRDQDATEIPNYKPKAEGKPARSAAPSRGPRSVDDGPRASSRRTDDGPPRARGAAFKPPSDARPRKGAAGPEHTARLYVGLGRAAGLRPGDLVGAIANEAGLDSGEIGAIQITEHFSFVEIPEQRAQDIIKALRASSIRGRKVKVELDHGKSAASAGAARPARPSRPTRKFKE